MLRESTAEDATEASGALGISSETVEESGGERRTAINAPPAEIFKAEANSRNSWPFSSWLRTKTGIAIGNRDHVRRSISDFLRFTGPRGNGLNTPLSQVWGQIKLEKRGFQYESLSPAEYYLNQHPKAAGNAV